MKNIILLLASFLSFVLHSQKTEIPIHAEVTGKGQPVMFLPGFTVPGSSWDATVAQLESDYECHVITLAGFGGTAPVEFPWLPKVTQALEDYIIQNQLSDLTIVGHSLGGTIAAWLASRKTVTLSQIILVDALPAAGALMIPDFNPDNLGYESAYNKQLMTMTESEFEQMAAGMALGMSQNVEAQQKIKEWILLADRETYVYGYTDYLKLDVREALKRISVPVTIIAADKPFGKEAVLETYKSQYSNLSDYQMVMANNAAHFVMFDQPEWFSDQLKRILSSH